MHTESKGEVRGQSQGPEPVAESGGRVRGRVGARVRGRVGGRVRGQSQGQRQVQLLKQCKTSGRQNHGTIFESCSLEKPALQSWPDSCNVFKGQCSCDKNCEMQNQHASSICSLDQARSRKQQTTLHKQNGACAKDHHGTCFSLKAITDAGDPLL